MASCATCWASSRVGHRIRAPGVAALKWRALVGSLRLGFLGGASPRAWASAARRWNSARSASSAAACCWIRVCSTGSRKAAVLPLPVWLETIRSTKPADVGAHGQGNGLVLHGGRLGEAQASTADTSSGPGPDARSRWASQARQRRRAPRARTSAPSARAIGELEEDCAGTKSPCASKASVMYRTFLHASSGRGPLLRRMVKNINHPTTSSPAVAVAAAHSKGHAVQDREMRETLPAHLVQLRQRSPRLSHGLGFLPNRSSFSRKFRGSAPVPRSTRARRPGLCAPAAS